MKSRITGRTENFHNKLEIHPKGSLTSPKETTVCPNCGWIMHPSLSSSYPFNFCVKCGYPVKFLKRFKDLDGFDYIDHRTGLKLSVMKDSPLVGLMGSVVSVEDLKKFVKEKGKRIGREVD